MHDSIQPDYFSEFDGDGQNSAGEQMENGAELRAAAYVIGVYVTGLIIVFGIAGNLLSFWVLLQSGRRSSMYCIMEAMCVSDTVMLVANLAFQVLPNLKDHFDAFYVFYHIYGQLSIISWPMSFAAQMTTVWLTVLISAERCCAVCKPLLTSKYCTYKRTRFTCCALFIISLAYCSPRFFEYKLCKRHSAEFYNNNSSNFSSDEFIPFCQRQENGTGYFLEKNPAIGAAYSVAYCAILYFLFAFLIPIVLIGVLNARLLLELRRSKEMWAQLSRHQKKEQKITKLPICIVIIFLICGAPALAVNVLDAAQVGQGNYWDVLITIGNLLIMFNSAINFIVYCVVGKDFRVALVYVLYCKEPRTRSSSYAVSSISCRESNNTDVSTKLIANGRKISTTQNKSSLCNGLNGSSSAITFASATFAINTCSSTVLNSVRSCPNY